MYAFVAKRQQLSRYTAVFGSGNEHKLPLVRKDKFGQLVCKQGPAYVGNLQGQYVGTGLLAFT